MRGLTITRDVILTAVQQSTSYKEVANALGRYPGQYFINQLKHWINEFNIDQSHLCCNVSADRWTYDNVAEAVKCSLSYTDALLALGIKERSGNFNTLKKKIREYGISTDHFDANVASTLKKVSRGSDTTIPLTDILRGMHPTYKTGQLKKRLIDGEVKENKCECCGIDSWNGAPIVLELDHINGISNDHRLSNLRLLCPNCHSQTPTFKGKNKSRVN